jgi:hypothetical protein
MVEFVKGAALFPLGLIAFVVKIPFSYAIFRVLRCFLQGRVSLQTLLQNFLDLSVPMLQAHR